MIYRNVGNRVAVDFTSLNLSISYEEALSILNDRKIRPISVNVIDLAKSLVGVAMWRWGSKQWEAPYYFDCSALTKWLYGQIGLWLPRRALQQLEFCKKDGKIIEPANLTPGDLVFSSSHFKNGVRTNSDEGIGHVFIATGDNRAISATNSELGCGVTSMHIEEIASTRKIRAIARVCELGTITTLLVPPGVEIESSDDIKYILAHS
jgi:cell wall-associated NlpC family hydrolase